MPMTMKLLAFLHDASDDDDDYDDDQDDDEFLAFLHDVRRRKEGGLHCVGWDGPLTAKIRSEDHDHHHHDVFDFDEEDHHDHHHHDVFDDDDDKAHLHFTEFAICAAFMFDLYITA